MDDPKAVVNAFRKRKADKQPVLKRPSAKASMPKQRKVIVEVDKKHIEAALPKLPSDGSNPAPVKYTGGVIYTSQKARSFRTLTTRGDNYYEKPNSKWKAKKPSQVEWRTAYSHIDRARAKSG